MRILLQHCSEVGSASEYARRHGFTRAFIAQVISGHRPPSKRLCSALGLKEDGTRWVATHEGPLPGTIHPRPPRRKPRKRRRGKRKPRGTALGRLGLSPAVLKRYRDESRAKEREGDAPADEERSS